MKWQVSLWPANVEVSHGCAGPLERLVAAGAVHAELGEQRVIKLRHLVSGLVARVHADPGTSRLHPLGDQPRTGQEPARIFRIDAQFHGMSFGTDGRRTEAHVLARRDAELLLQ